MHHQTAEYYLDPEFVSEDPMEVRSCSIILRLKRATEELTDSMINRRMASTRGIDRVQTLRGTPHLVAVHYDRSLIAIPAIVRALRELDRNAACVSC